MPTWISFILLLCLLSSVHAAFVGTTCNPSKVLCVERSRNGGAGVCFYANVSTSDWACRNTTFQLPLEAHLNQKYSIGHYSATGQHLGGWNFSLIGTTPPIYVCMSARVNITSAEYVTLCAEVRADNNWEGGGCGVNVVPANVLDGCYTGPDTRATITTRATTTISTFQTDDILGGPSQVGTPIATATVPGPPFTSNTSIKRNILKDSRYSVIWAPIMIFLTLVMQL